MIRRTCTRAPPAATSGGTVHAGYTREDYLLTVYTGGCTYPGVSRDVHGRHTSPPGLPGRLEAAFQAVSLLLGTWEAVFRAVLSLLGRPGSCLSSSSLSF